MSTKTSIGFIGLGVMGEPMCKNLCQKLLLESQGNSASGVSQELFSINVYDVDAARAEGFGVLGAQICANIEQLAKQADIILLSLPGGAEVQQVLIGPSGVYSQARQGVTVVDCSTSPVTLTRELAIQAKEHGIRYVDSPVARTRRAAETGTLAMSVGGDVADVERVRPILECMATDVLHVGAVGNGQLVKILNNMVLFQTVNALAEAQELKQHALSALLPEKFPEQAFSVAYAKKDLHYALELAKETETTVTGAQHVDDLFARAISQGYAEQYWPVISALLKKTR